MKKTIIMFIVILILLVTTPLTVSAQTPSPTPVATNSPAATAVPASTAITPVTVLDNKAAVTLAQMGFRDDTLTSPFDSTRVLFSTPANWKLSSGGELEINYDVLFTGTDVAKLIDGVNPFGGSLTVVFNQKIIDTIPLEKAGSFSARIQIPSEALNSAREDGRHQLTISLDAQFSCVYDIKANVVIKSTSAFNLPFEVSPPVLNLAKLPAPFYLQNGLIPDNTFLVTSDNPSTGELQAALNIMAGFGSLVGADINLEMVNIGALTNDDLASSNLIFVGKPDQLGLLPKIAFPLMVANGKFVNMPDASANDGVLQMAISPWNQNKVVLLASGNSDEAVAKAAHAVSSGRIFTYDNPILSYVSDVQLLVDNIPVVEDFSFQNLGYPTQTLSGIGLFTADYVFPVSKEQIAAKDGYLDLVYYHSGLLDYSVSSLSVSLNDQLINGTPFSKETEKLTTLRINIPPGALRYGQNRLTVSARMLTTNSCDATGFSTPWMIVSDQSRIHIPVTTVDNSLNQLALDLKSYPNLFLTHSDLGDLAFVLPKSSLDSLRIAGKLAYNFGKTATPLIPNLTASYADDVSKEVRTNKTMIVIGKASASPLVSELNDRLPAPFNLKDDTASEGNMQITYRVPAGVSVGYLELLNSPFNIEKSILVVSGNTDQGLVMAGDALVQADLVSQLAGLFVVTNGTKIAASATSSNFSIIGNIVPGAEAIINQPVLPSAKPVTKLPPPSWLMPIIISSVLIIVIVLAYVIGMAMMRRRSKKIEVLPESLDEEG